LGDADMRHEVSCPGRFVPKMGCEGGASWFW
jgi:hypothetical protein